MSFRERAFSGVEDERALRAFCQREAADAFYTGQLHPGDIVWRLYQNTELDPTRSLRLWEDEDGRLLAHAWCEPARRSLQLALARDRSDDRQLQSAILDWVEGLAGPGGALTAEDLGGAPALSELLAQRGYLESGETMRQLGRSLAGELEQPILPDGFSVRPVGGPDEWEARVELHRTVWNPSRVTLPAYVRLRLAEGYDPELDLVVVAPGGELAAYCIAWLDHGPQTGYLEPVGTHPAWRGRGLGKALLLDAQRRMRERGCSHALVYAHGSSEPARALYRSAGFAELGMTRFRSRDV